MVSMLLNKNRRGFVKKADKILAVKQAQFDFFNSEVEIYRKSGVIPASVKKFVKTADITPLSSGSANVPTDFAQEVSGETSSGKELTLLTSEEFIDRKYSEILAGDQEHPIAKIENGKIFVEPDEFTSIKLTYFRRPIDFVYNTTLSGDSRSETFDAGTSTDIEFTIDHSKGIILRALKYLGVTYQNEEALTLAMNDKKE
jgi:hypothetical protein